MDPREEDAVVERLRRDHGLWPADAPVRLLAAGTENRTFAVDDLVVRVSVAPPDERGDAVVREARLLRLLAAAGAPVPVPLVAEADVLVYRRVPGTPLLHAGPPDLDALVPAVVRVLRALHDVGPRAGMVVDEQTLEEWLDDAREAYGRARPLLSPDEDAAVRAFLGTPPPDDADVRVPCHADLGTEHLLVDDAGTLTGVIDWTDAALTDPGRDLGRLRRDLGPDAARAVAVALGHDDATLARAAFHARCAWVEDVAHAAGGEGREAYARAAHRSFATTFPGRFADG